MTTSNTKMEIIELDSAEFKSLDLNLEKAKSVGEYEKAGKNRRVMVVNEFVLVNIEEDPGSVGLLKADSVGEAIQYAGKIIKRANRSQTTAHSKITLTR